MHIYIYIDTHTDTYMYDFKYAKEKSQLPQKVLNY